LSRIKHNQTELVCNRAVIIKNGRRRPIFTEHPFVKKNKNLSIIADRTDLRFSRDEFDFGMHLREHDV